MRHVRTAAVGAAALGLLLAVGACERGRAGAGWTGTVDTLASGTVVVSNPREGAWAEGAGWRLVEEIRVGDIDMEEPEIFARVNAVVADEQDRVYLLDRPSHRIQVFDREGRWVRSIGREGNGPGELADPVGMIRDPDGRLVVADPGNARFTVFDTSGAYVAGHPRRATGYSVPWRACYDDAGRMAEIAYVFRDGEGRHSVIRHDDDFRPVDTIPLPPAESERFVHTTENGRMAAAVPFSGGQQATLGPDGGIWVADSRTYRIVRLDDEGDTLLVIEKEAERIPVTPEEREQAVENLEWFTRQGGSVDPSRIPDVKPYFTQLWVGGDGHLRVLRSAPADAESHRMDVFDPEGRYLGPVSLPFRPGYSSVFEGERVLAVTADELGVNYVVRMRRLTSNAAADSPPE